MALTALITGAGRNMGRHLALRFAESGYQVVVCARTAESVESVAQEVRAASGLALALPTDFGDPEQVSDLMQAAQTTYGGVDVLINCAVVRVQRPITEMTFDEWRLVTGTVLDGAFNCAKAVIPGMIERGRGRILSLTGTSGMKGSPDRVGIAAAKMGLEGYTRGLASELAPHGVTVNAIAPGNIATQRGAWTAVGDADAVKAHYEHNQRSIPMGRPGTQDEVAGLALYLASDIAGYITGQTICINGGVYMR